MKQLHINLEVWFFGGRIDFSEENIRHAVSIKIQIRVGMWRRDNISVVGIHAERVICTSQHVI
jgi:hypothetical protein